MGIAMVERGKKLDKDTTFFFFSFVHAKQLRERLQKLLGSEVIKVNDKLFMDFVAHKLAEESQVNLQANRHV